MKLPDLYPFKKGRCLFYLRVKDIDYVKGEGNCSGFYFMNGSFHMENLNIGRHWNLLKAFDYFMRIQRSFVVNLKAIRGISTDGIVTLKSGLQVTCSGKLLDELLERYPIVGK